MKEKLGKAFGKWHLNCVSKEELAFDPKVWEEEKVSIRGRACSPECFSPSTSTLLFPICSVTNTVCLYLALPLPSPKKHLLLGQRTYLPNCSPGCHLCLFPICHSSLFRQASSLGDWIPSSITGRTGNMAEHQNEIAAGHPGEGFLKAVRV